MAYALWIIIVSHGFFSNTTSQSVVYFKDRQTCESVSKLINDRKLNIASSCIFTGNV